MSKRINPGGFARRFRRLARLTRDTRAATAVEFALLGSTFMLLVCMTIELGLVLFTQSVLDNALRDGARLIRTNQASSSSTFITQVCSEVGTVLITSCSSNLQYYVATASLFSSLTAKTTTLPNTYTAGSSAADMLAQVAYKRNTIIPWAAQYLGNSDLIISTVAFQNEPY